MFSKLTIIITMITIIKIYIKPLVEQKMKKKINQYETSQVIFQDTVLRSLKAGDAIENSSVSKITHKIHVLIDLKDKLGL